MARRAASLLLLVVCGGCGGCRDSHPYVPYSIEATAAATASASAGERVDAGRPSAGAEAGGDPFAGEPSIVAPPSLSQWQLEGLALDAPPGLVFVSAAVRDFDGDGAPDAFAIVRPADGADPGELVFYRGPAPPGASFAPTTVIAPPELARAEGCSAVDRLVVVGRRSVFAEIGVQCPAHPSDAPDRWVAVVAGAAPSAKVRLAATIADPASAPVLSVDAVAEDRDHDGLEDLSLRVAIEGGGPPLEPGPRVVASLAWLDRPAGLSRDAGATEASFEALASFASSHAGRAKEAPSVPIYVAQARALWRATCAEGSSPRLVGVAGTGAITCGAARALEDLGIAETRAYATMSEPLRAALALDRAQRPPASRTPSRVSEAQKWITQGAPVALARVVRAVAAVPAATKGHEPTWGVLAFEGTGKLLVRTSAGAARVDPDQGDEAAADGVDWKPAVTSADKSLRWIEAYDPCDGLPVRATFAPASGDDVRDIALPVPPLLGGRCLGSRGAPARALAVAWGAGGLEAVVDGELVLVSPDLTRASPLTAFLGQPVALGAPRSPDGKTYVFATGAGLLVQGPARTRLYRARELDGTYAEQTDCAVSNDATHVACVHAGKAWVGTWDAP